MSIHEAEKVLKDVRAFYNGKFECTLRNLVDFMTKKKINVAFVEKGSIDPLLANTVQAVSKVKDTHDLTFEILFNMLDAGNSGYATKEQFTVCLQGMNLGVAPEDITELFNSLDELEMNRINKKQFSDKMTYYSSRMGGPSVLEQSMNKGIIGAKKKPAETDRKSVV